ncbi:hypothetical protein [Sphingomonas molluscorum]
MGSCTGPLHDKTDWQQLYHEADGALFAAKHAGRNRAHHARPALHAA